MKVLLIVQFLLNSWIVSKGPVIWCEVVFHTRWCFIEILHTPDVSSEHMAIIWFLKRNTI